MSSASDTALSTLYRSGSETASRNRLFEITCYRDPNEHLRVLLLLVASYDRPVWCRLNDCRLLDQSVEQRASAAGFPMVEPDAEFFQVIIEVTAADRPLVCPGLSVSEQRGNPMHMRQQLQRQLRVPQHVHLVRVSQILQLRLARKSVGMHRRAWLDCLADESRQPPLQNVRNDTHAGAPGPRSFLSYFDRDRDQRIGSGLPVAHSLFLAPDIGFVLRRDR